jgi:hypothetical protein
MIFSLALLLLASPAPAAAKSANKTGASTEALRRVLSVVDGGDDNRLLVQQNDSITLLTACSHTPDCPTGEYCDYSHSCYHCSYLTKKCDALGGDCCSATFLHNCPSNPLKALCHPCEAALVTACNSTRTKTFDCARCSGIHQHDLKVAGCTNDQIARWCAGQPANPPPPPPRWEQNMACTHFVSKDLNRHTTVCDGWHPDSQVDI